MRKTRHHAEHGQFHERHEILLAENAGQFALLIPIVLDAFRSRQAVLVQARYLESAAVSDRYNRKQMTPVPTRGTKVDGVIWRNFIEIPARRITALLEALFDFTIGRRISNRHRDNPLTGILIFNFPGNDREDVINAL